MKVKLGTGKVVELVDEYGPAQTLRAAELADVPAQMTFAESLTYNYATVMVAVKTIDGQTVEAITQGKVAAKAMIMAFREAFTDAEWSQLTKATNEVFESPKLTVGYEIVS